MWNTWQPWGLRHSLSPGPTPGAGAGKAGAVTHPPRSHPRGILATVGLKVACRLAAASLRHDSQPGRSGARAPARSGTATGPAALPGGSRAQELVNEEGNHRLSTLTVNNAPPRGRPAEPAQTVCSHRPGEVRWKLDGSCVGSPGVSRSSQALWQRVGEPQGGEGSRWRGGPPGAGGRQAGCSERTDTHSNRQRGAGERTVPPAPAGPCRPPLGGCKEPPTSEAGEEACTCVS